MWIELNWLRVESSGCEKQNICHSRKRCQIIGVSYSDQTSDFFPRVSAAKLGYPVPGGNKYRNLALQVWGVSKIETIKYAHESRGTQI
jgi:hypothetical protein